MCKPWMQEVLARKNDCSQVGPRAVMATRQLEKIIKHYNEQAFIN